MCVRRSWTGSISCAGRMVLRDAAKTCTGRRTVRLNRIDRYWCSGPDACGYSIDVWGDLGTAISHAGTAYMRALRSSVTAIFTTL
jgi:hypothetical protein